MAYIKKVGENRYQIRVNAGRDSRGKRLYPSKTVTGTRKQAERHARELESSRDMGTLITESRVTLDEYLDQWLKVIKHEIRLITLEHYISTIDRHIRPTLGHKKLTQVHPSDMEDFYTELLDGGLGRGTVRNIHAILSKAFRRAFRLRMLPYNPLADTVPPNYKPEEAQSFTPEEALRFLEAAKEDEHHLLFNFVLHTGLRPEEYLGLTWSNLELDAKDSTGRPRGIAKVRQTVVVNLDGNGWYWSKPKTEKGLRDVFFPHSIAQELKVHRARQNESRLSLGRHYQKNDLVFPTSIGTPHRRINISRRHFKPILERAGISDRRLYCLRHSYATLSLLAGVDPKVVSTQMGHASVAFTLTVYHHVLAGMRESAADQLENFLLGTQEAQRAAKG